MQPVVLMALTARADPTSPARRCADSAEGTEIEVCLRLAAEDPRAVEEIASALIARLDRGVAPDRALLDAVLLLATERPEDGVALLQVIDDPRAVPVLWWVAETGGPSLATAALGALSAYPQSVPTLAAWVLDDRRAVALRIAAAAALGRVGRTPAADALQDALRARLPAPVRAEVARALAEADPGRWSQRPVPPSSDPAPWLATGAAVGLGYAMVAGAYLGDPPPERPDTPPPGLLPPVELWQVGGTTGAVAGASLGWAWGRAWPIEAGDAALVATTGIGVTAAGLLVGSAFPNEDRPAEPALLGGLAGEVVGYSIGFAARGPYAGSGPDATEALALGLLLAGGAEAVGRFASGEAAGAHRVGTGLALAAGLGIGHVVSPQIDLRSSAALALSGGALGAGVGVVAPVGDGDRGALVAGGALLGTGLGAALSWRVRPPTDVLVGGFGGGVVGVGIGAGVGLTASPDAPELARGLAVGFGAAGFGVGAVAAALDPDPIDDRDVALGLAAAGWAGWNVAAAGEWLGVDPERSGGAVLLAGGIAVGGASALNLVLDVPVPHTLSATSIGLWGGYAGWALAELANPPTGARRLDPLALALPGSDLGLVGGALLVSPQLGVPPLAIATADAFGAIGASVGATGAGLARGDRRAVAAWSLAGAAVGLTGGSWLGARWSRDLSRRDLALAPRLSLPPIQLGALPVAGGAGVAVQVTGW